MDREVHMETTVMEIGERKKFEWVFRLSIMLILNDVSSRAKHQ